MRKHRYKKFYRIKRKKSLLKNKFFWLGFLFLIALGALFYAVFFSSFFQIREIRISGNQGVPTEEIVSSFSRGNILLVDTKEINRAILEKFPKIAKVNTKRGFPDALIVQIEERKPVAVFSRDGDYFFIDIEGVIFEKISEKPSNMLVIKSERDSIGKEMLDKILKINSKLKDDLGIPFEEILIVSDERLNVKTLDGWEIYFNPKGNLDWQLEELAIVLKERIPPKNRGNLKYIDLRFEKIFIFPETI